MEEHDRGFEKKYDEDLNTTLIFVSVSARTYSTGGGGLRTARDLMFTMRFRAVWFVLGDDLGVHRRHTIGSRLS